MTERESRIQRVRRFLHSRNWTLAAECEVDIAEFVEHYAQEKAKECDDLANEVKALRREVERYEAMIGNTVSMVFTDLAIIHIESGWALNRRDADQIFDTALEAFEALCDTPVGREG